MTEASKFMKVKIILKMILGKRCAETKKYNSNKRRDQNCRKRTK